MLINPYRDKLNVIPGTRFLEDALGIANTYVQDPLEPGRHWYIQWLLAPVPGRHLGGVRAKLVDTKGFITFCNQRDLEVIMRYAKPGEYCQWTGADYVGPYDEDWYGLCCDDEDLKDDLFERECRLREQLGQPYLQSGLEISRRIHHNHSQDYEELLTLLWDMDRDTGIYPDPRLETVCRRWARVERTSMMWTRV